MKALRHRRGALSLEGLEARAVFDGDALADLRPDAPNRAKQLIEDFMIAANGVTARFLQARGVAALRRVLRTPERWDRIVELAPFSRAPALRSRAVRCRRPGVGAPPIPTARRPPCRS